MMDELLRQLQAWLPVTVPPWAAAVALLLVLLLVAMILAARTKRRMSRQVRDLRDRLAELDELLVKERSSLAHCRERMSQQERAFAPTQQQLRAVRKLLHVAEVAEDGRLLGANRRLLRLLGAEDGPPPPWPAGWLAAWLQAQPRLHEGKAWQGRVALGDDHPNALWLQIGALPAAEGEAPRFLAVASELSPLERRHRELIDSLERQGDLLDGLQMGGWSWDVDADRLRLDRRLLALLGLPSAGPVQTTGQQFLREHLHADDSASWRDAMQATLSARSDGMDLRLRLRHADGRWLTLQARAAVVRRGPAGEPLRVAGGLLSVQARAEADGGADWELALAQAQRGLAQGAFLWKPGADQWRWNAAALHLLERAEAPALPADLALLALHEDDRASLRAGLALAAAGQAWQGDVRLLGALGHERAMRVSLAGGADAVLGLLQARQRAQPSLREVRVPPALQQRCAAQGVQLALALQRFDGDPGLLQRTVRDLGLSSRTLATALAGLGDATEPGFAARRREAEQALHAFQAVSTTLGCEALAQTARGGLQRVRSGEALAPAWLDDFARRRKDSLAALLAASNELLAPRLVEEVAPEGVELASLRRLVGARDPAAHALLQTQQAQLAPWLGERAAPLQAALAAADYDAAWALLAA